MCALKPLKETLAFERQEPTPTQITLNEVALSSQKEKREDWFKLSILPAGVGAMPNGYLKSNVTQINLFNFNIVRETLRWR